MLEASLANLNALLKTATDPETIKALTEAIEDTNKAIEGLSLKDALIERQAKEIKRVYLNDSPSIPNKKDEPIQQPAQPPHVPTIEEILDKIDKEVK